jgi:hypothetical protein
MAWSYRQDRSDETYHEPGVFLVEGEKLPHTPASAQHAKEMLDPKLVEKREKEEEKFKEEQKKQAEKDAHMVGLSGERERIRAEEQARVAQEERDKELDKIRKEEAENAKKAVNAKKEPAHAHAK